jgi:hypothetical protein
MKHIVNVTISNPAHDFVSMRSRQSTTNYMVEAKNEAEAILRASRHFKSLGHYVHNAVIVESTLNEDVEQIDEAMQVRAYDKNGKLVGNYRSMADAKKFKPGHNYKTVKENVEHIDEVNARHSPEAAQAVLTPTAKIVRAAVGKSARDKAATKKYARRVANISPDYSKKDVMDHLKNMGEEVELDEDALKAREQWMKAKGVSTGNPKADRARKVKRLMKTFPMKKEEVELDEALDLEVNNYAKHMLNAHSADDLHVGNEHRDMAHQTLQDIKKNYGPVGVRWANARAGEHIENHNKAQREAEKASVMKRYKPTPPGAKVYQYPKSEVKEEVKQIDEISDSLLRRAKNKADYNKMNTNDNATFQKNQDHEDKLTDAEYKRSARRGRLGIPDDPRPAAAPKKKLNFIQRMAKNRKDEKEAAAFLRRVSGLHNEEVVNEKAPPGAKYERMVKHIKNQYSKDGTLTPKEKAIAYATAWEAKNSGK